ncbi:hypothetical protein PVAND_001661 [Polypedilum vanderplanki]|uniref:Uncharacterized protein n=1 Tax=Polypedilum vanderplanki TaxID=319348 RepID=A0A9J6BNW3_POLVA|nr:hypothetical protein PVAND_001661 [Polypedilum vanderplanki]
MSQFPKVPNAVAKNYVIGRDFDVMKKNPVEKFEQKLFKYNVDRMIPTRNELKPRFLRENNEKEFNVMLSENDLKTMKKTQYQNQIRNIFNQEYEHKIENDKNSKDNKNKTGLIHLDWACKLINIREKFLPDFETLEKRSFQRIDSYIWSSKQIIASSSYKKVCLYHPINGFTRALDINDKVCITFSNSGDYLAMAYRKSSRGYHFHDLYVFQIKHEALFTDEKLETEKIRTNIDSDITALCYTKNDRYLMCGTNKGEIYVIRQSNDPKKRISYWTLMNKLTTKHDCEITKISFSATHKYMATIDKQGVFQIWNGGSWTSIFIYHYSENSHLYKHFEWHPFVDNELIIAKRFYPAIHLFNVTQRKIVATFMSWKEDWELTSIAFNPKTAQLAVCFYNAEEFINRVSILASMSQVISSFDFDYIEGGLKLFWNTNGTMLGAGARSFRFAFWSFQKNTTDFNFLSKERSITENRKKPAKLLTLSDSKIGCLR